MDLKKNCKWSLLVPTSMGIRLTPIAHGQPIHKSENMFMQATSAETNVASIPAYLGLPVKVLTTFVKGSPIAQFIKDNLRSRNLCFEGKDVEQGGPWGYRHQINIADSGFGARGPRVWNDRTGEVGRTLNVKDFDLERIFNQEGVQILHISGLIAALSEKTSEFCLELVKTAKKYGTKISFDLNYRATFWKGREKELRAAFSEMANLADILIGNEEDFQLCFGIKGADTSGKDLSTKMENFKTMIQGIKTQFPNTSFFATTLREVIDANTHLWGAIVLNEDTWHEIPPRQIHVLDRIGGGDGFVGGLLYGILKNWDTEKCAQFGWATGALATTFLTDYGQPADEEQVWSIWKGNARVVR